MVMVIANFLLTATRKSLWLFVVIPTFFIISVGLLSLDDSQIVMLWFLRVIYFFAHPLERHMDSFKTADIVLAFSVLSILLALIEKLYYRLKKIKPNKNNLVKKWLAGTLIILGLNTISISYFYFSQLLDPVEGPRLVGIFLLFCLISVLAYTGIFLITWVEKALGSILFKHEAWTGGEKLWPAI